MTDPRQRVRPQGSAVGERERVLARRRMALVVLAALVPVTLVLAIVTGSLMLLVLNLVADVLIAVYVALLLQIKQAQGAGRVEAGAGRAGSPEDVPVVQR